MGLVTVLRVFRTTGAGETGFQVTGETKFVADCRVNPVALADQVKMTFAPERVMVSCGGLTGLNVRLNTVPVPELPP